MNCPDIKEKLSAYLDGMTDPAEKAAIEQHLSSCRQCSAYRAELEKTVGRLRNLEGIEPPPWLSQKVMARIREEKQKKGFIQKLFYPLHVKVPIHALATVLIAVITVYIFKAIQPEVLQQPVAPAEQMSKAMPESGRRAEIPATQAPAPARKQDRMAIPEEARRKEAAPLADYAPVTRPAPEEMIVPQQAEKRALGEMEKTGDVSGASRLPLDATEAGKSQLRASAPAAPAPLAVSKKPAVLFSRRDVVPDDIAKVLEVAVATEARNRVVLEVEYYVSKRVEGRVSMSIFPNIPEWTASEIAIAQGRRVVRVPLEFSSSEGALVRESSNLTIEMSAAGKNEPRATLLRMVIPYRKIWSRP